MNSKILWAVDPFSGEWKAQKGAARAIAALSARSGCEIQPVYLAANPLSNLPQGFTVEVFEGVREKAQDRFDQMVADIPLKSVAPLKIIQLRNLSTSEQVTELLSYAHELGAELIVTGTRARSGVPRWFFGSFAESLSLRSDVPLLIVNPSWSVEISDSSRVAAETFKEILFPTDFSDASHEAFRQVLLFAREAGSAVRIFHKYYHVAAPVWNSPIEAKLSYRGIFEDGLRQVNRTAEAWVAQAKEQGVEATSEIDSGPGESTSDAILERARSENCLIAMAAQSGGLEVRLLGSVTRKVIRAATNPVWVLHTRRHAAGAEEQPSDDSRLRNYEERKGLKFPKVL